MHSIHELQDHGSVLIIAVAKQFFDHHNTYKGACRKIDFERSSINELELWVLRGSSGAWQLHQFNGELVSGFVGASPQLEGASLSLMPQHLQLN